MILKQVIRIHKLQKSTMEDEMDTSKLIFTNADGTLSFGDYTLPEKKKGI